MAPRDDPSPEGMGTVYAPSMVASAVASEGAGSYSNGARLVVESAPGQSVCSQEATPT